MKTEQTFMMVFRYTPNSEYIPTSEEIRQMKEDWGSFIGNLAIKEKLESTSQLGSTGRRVSADLTISEGVFLSDNKMVSGNMVVKANSIDEATELAKDCPILKMGGSVEIREIIPMNH
ncbi:MAG: YciI family protein [Crocinitomicaceae bacterium]